jgi:hypothetical protein
MFRELFSGYRRAPISAYEPIVPCCRSLLKLYRLPQHLSFFSSSSSSLLRYFNFIFYTPSSANIKVASRIYDGNFCNILSLRTRRCRSVFQTKNDEGKLFLFSTSRPSSKFFFAGRNWYLPPTRVLKGSSPSTQIKKHTHCRRSSFFFLSARISNLYDQ